MAALSILQPILALDDTVLTEWIRKLVRERSTPELRIPSDYRSAVDYLTALIYATKDETISLRFGNAAGTAFLAFYEETRADFTNTDDINTTEIKSDFLFLLESLPKEKALARRLVALILRLISTFSLVEASPAEINLYRGIVLTLGGSLENADYTSKIPPPFLIKALEHKELSAAACATLILLCPEHATDYCRQTFSTLKAASISPLLLIISLSLYKKKGQINGPAIREIIAQEFGANELAEFDRE